MSVMIKEAALSEQEMVAEAERALEDISKVRPAVGKVIFGQESVVERTLVALLAGGHALLVGVPGLAKTKLVETLGTVLGLDARRIQFTPDLMPSDILGSEVMEQDDNGQALVPLHSRARSSRSC
jgi:MoxR-like ATPase